MKEQWFDQFTKKYIELEINYEIKLKPAVIDYELKNMCQTQYKLCI